ISSNTFLKKNVPLTFKKLGHGLLITIVYYCFSGLIVVTVEPGDDVILPCQADDSSISAVEWTRPDLEPDTSSIQRWTLGYNDQHPSFEDRVELVDRDLKDGDVSLILKNVSSIDTGIYECRVRTDGSDPIRTIRTIRTVRLQVPGE
uniref:Ig-like domain-containing protein n=1 Tax=Sander lucioperca TaxID=283035 RepID=A0A8C9XV15_SANLU